MALGKIRKIEALAQAGLKLSVLIPVYNERFLIREVIRRVRNVSLDPIREMEIIIVDDGSTDGTGEVLDELASEHPNLKYLKHPRNRGKGAALRTAIEAATGDLTIVQDADLEYDPRDYGNLIRPFLEDGADVVYGSRFLAGRHRRVLFYRHALGNMVLTHFTNLLTDLNLSDVETGYKMFRTPLLKSIPIRSNDFAIEVEITSKIAKRNFRIFEVPISYAGRTYQEGKKIGWRDGVKAIVTAIRFWLIDDLYKEDEYGGRILHALERARRFNFWMADAIRPSVGARVLEIGAGIGNITACLLPRDTYLATDINEHYLHYLKNFSVGKPYLSVERVDVEDPDSFAELRDKFDTVLCLNVLEHVKNPMTALRNMYNSLGHGGRLILYVPQGSRLYSSLDRALEHRCRYDRETLERELTDAGFEMVSRRHFNKASVPAWWVNGRVLKRKALGRWQLKFFDLGIPILRRIDPLLPWKGLGLIAVARKPSPSK